MKDIYTNYSPAFWNLAESIAAEKGIKLMDITGSESKWMNFFKDSSQSEICVITAIKDEDIAYGVKVTPGVFLDALMVFKPAPKSIKLKTQLLGYQPVVTGETVRIGCQTFSLEAIKQFQKEYEDWEQSGKIEFPDCYTDSSTELRAYARLICPSCIRNSLGRAETRFRYLALYRWNDNMCLSGEPHEKGEKLSGSQFIARLEEAKSARKEKKGKITEFMGFLSYELTDGPQDVFFPSYGSISHGELKEFFAELENIRG